MPIGFLIGLPLGPVIKNQLGYVPLFTIASLVTLTSIIYVIFIMKESIPAETKPTDPNAIKLRPDKGEAKAE